MIGNIRIEQREVELNVQRFFIQLPRQIHACASGGIDVLVEIEHKIVRDNRVAGCEERDEAIDQVPFRGAQARAQIRDVVDEKSTSVDGPSTF